MNYKFLRKISLELLHRTVNFTQEELKEQLEILKIKGHEVLASEDLASMQREYIRICHEIENKDKKEQPAVEEILQKFLIAQTSGTLKDEISYECAMKKYGVNDDGLTEKLMCLPEAQAQEMVKNHFLEQLNIKNIKKIAE